MEGQRGTSTVPGRTQPVPLAAPRDALMTQRGPSVQGSPVFAQIGIATSHDQFQIMMLKLHKRAY